MHHYAAQGGVVPRDSRSNARRRLSRNYDGPLSAARKLLSKSDTTPRVVRDTARGVADEGAASITGVDCEVLPLKPEATEQRTFHGVSINFRSYRSSDGTPAASGNEVGRTHARGDGLALTGSKYIETKQTTEATCDYFCSF